MLIYQVTTFYHEDISAIQNLKAKMTEPLETEGRISPIIQTQIIMMDCQAHKSRGALQLVDAFLGFVIFFVVLRSVTILIG